MLLLVFGQPACFRATHTEPAARALAVYSTMRTKMVDVAHTPIPESGLSESRAVELALENDAGLKALRAEFRVAEAEVENAGQLENPEIRVTQFRVRDLVEGTPSIDLSLRAPIPRPGEMDALVAEAKAAAAVADADVATGSRRVASEVRLLYQELLLLDAETQAAHASVEIRTRLLDLVQKQAQSGITTKVDLAYAELALEQAHQEHMMLKAQRVSARIALLERLGLRTDIELTLDAPKIDPEQEPQPLGSMEDLIQEALKNRPALAAAAARIDLAAAVTYQERIKAWPWFSFVEIGYDVGPDPVEGTEWSFGLAVEIPLFSTNSGGIAVAEAEQHRVASEFDAEVEAVVRSVQKRYRQATEALNALTEASRGLRKAAEAAAMQLQAALVASRVDMVEVAMLEDRRLEAQRRLLKMVRRYYEARVELFDTVRGGALYGAPTIN